MQALRYVFQQHTSYAEEIGIDGLLAGRAGHRAAAAIFIRADVNNVDRRARLLAFSITPCGVGALNVLIIGI